MLAVLSVFWSCRGTKSAEDLDYCPKLGLTLKLAPCYPLRRGHGRTMDWTEALDIIADVNG